ncbi:unnamed protein product, partial [Scytosiphon promiscuus]
MVHDKTLQTCVFVFVASVLCGWSSQVGLSLCHISFSSNMHGCTCVVKDTAHRIWYLFRNSRAHLPPVYRSRRKRVSTITFTKKKPKGESISSCRATKIHAAGTNSFRDGKVLARPVPWVCAIVTFKRRRSGFG